MNPLDEFVRAEIKRDGSMSFARLMELALYCPQFGYYDRIENRIGRRGDFYTSVSTGKSFGELLGFQFASWIRQLGDDEVQLLEAGAHDGQLAQDILKWLDSHEPAIFRRLRYWILEPLQAGQTAQRRTLEMFANVRWFPDWHALPPTGVRGVIFSNELLDAMPVHRLGWDAKFRKWFEWGVRVEGSDLAWTRLDLNAHFLESSFLATLSPELLRVLPDGFITELSPAATEWWRHAAGALHQGKLLTFDYGLDSEEFFAPERSNGTLRAYHRHRVSSDLLVRLGEQDLTAHVNFTALQATGEAAGLQTEGIFSQTDFLTRIFAAALGEHDGLATSTGTRQFMTLTHPEHLGRSFKVLVQSR